MNKYLFTLILCLKVVAHADSQDECAKIPNVYGVIACYEELNEILLLRLQELNNSATDDFKSWDRAVQQKCDTLDKDTMGSLQGAGMGLVKLSCYNEAYQNRIIELVKPMDANQNSEIIADDTSEKQYVELMKMIERGNVQYIKQLHDDGFDFNDIIDSRASETYLIHAIRYNKIEVVNLLLEYGADINMPNGDNRTPIEISIDYCFKPIYDILNAHSPNTSLSYKHDECMN